MVGYRGSGRSSGGGGDYYNYLSALSSLGGGKKKSWEAAVPVLLIAIIVVLALGKLGFINLSWIPGIGSLFAPSQVKVLVLSGTESLGAELADTLRTSTQAKQRGLVVDEQTKVEAWEFPTSDYEIIFLTREDLPNSFRQELSSFVQSGGKLVIIDTAGSEVTKGETLISETAPGWIDANWDTFVPVAKVNNTLANTITYDPLNFTISVDQGKLLFPQQVKGLQFTVSSTQQQLRVVREAADSTTLAYAVYDKGDGTYNFHPAIVEKSSGIGKVLYVSWNPAQSNNEVVLWSIVDYLRD